MADQTDKTDEIVKTDKTVKIKPKRLSKSERTHQRRLKQAARKPGAVGR
jgi:ribosomal protein S18